MLGVAQTGSGKTFAYLIPLLTHVLEQPELHRNEGPIALVLAPTRELCQQIYQVCASLCKMFEVNTIPIFGGVDPH